MSDRLIPFVNKKRSGPARVKTSRTALPLNSQGSKKTSDGDVLDHGTIGELKYEIYKRGVIHIFNDKCRFKKDINLFEDEINKIDFDNMSDDIVISGSGENDHLIFSKTDGELTIGLKKRDFEIIGKLKDILSRGKKKVGNG